MSATRPGSTSEAVWHCGAADHLQLVLGKQLRGRRRRGAAGVAESAGSQQFLARCKQQEWALYHSDAAVAGKVCSERLRSRFLPTRLPYSF